MKSWIKVKLSDLGNVVGGATPSTLNEDYYGGDIAWITPKDLSNFEGRFISHGERNITKLGLKSCSTTLLPKNTVLFTSRAPIGYVAISSNELATNQGFKSIVPNKNTDYLFLYYLLKYNKDKIEGMGSGTTFKEVSGATMKNIEVNVPQDKEEQIRIGKILSSLDDKIEQNTRMNKVLEEIARALFHRWFVAFEFPNAEGKPYKSAGGKMVESEMGSVPEGWETNTLDNVVDIIGGGTPKTSTSEYWNGTIPWFSVIDAPNDGDIFVIDTEKHITQLGIENSSTRLLPVGTTIISARGTVGKCAVVGIPMTMNQSCYGIRGKKEGVDYFVYFTIRGMVSELQSKGHGSVFNTITRDTINTQKIVVPDVSVMKKYNDHVTPLLQKIQTNLTENRHLSELRDGLLPKLMSGDIEV